ncbi:MAG: PilZ domain-containing protein [Lachnospiraceae bacterium]|nr:PilZ domain-containing protein [Lachnospiraceae bacterium]
MEEKRKSKRMDLAAHLIIKRVDGTKSERIPIDIIDLSKTGVGFNCNQLLEMNSMYEAELCIWTKEVIKAYINIIRMDQKEDHIVYGARFIGMNDTDASKIEIYDLFEESKKNS